MWQRQTSCSYRNRKSAAHYVCSLLMHTHTHTTSLHLISDRVGNKHSLGHEGCTRLSLGQINMCLQLGHGCWFHLAVVFKYSFFTVGSAMDGVRFYLSRSVSGSGHRTQTNHAAAEEKECAKPTDLRVPPYYVRDKPR